MAHKIARRAAVAVTSAAVVTAALVGAGGSASAAPLSTGAPVTVSAGSLGHATHDRGEQGNWSGHEGSGQRVRTHDEDRNSGYRYERDGHRYDRDAYRYDRDGHRHNRDAHRYNRDERWVRDHQDRSDRWDDNRASYRNFKDTGYDHSRQYRDSDSRFQNWISDRGERN
ncbi:hypothetical protein AB9Q10_20060 [Streptomyces krungchingensis]|uniref:hypothetical protein n=1 Tax=Streptomyces krungchingensis TaxID=1565034 RepID=UPI003CE6C95D